MPDNAFSGGPGSTSWWQPTGATGSTGNLTLAVDFAAPRNLTTVNATWYGACYMPVDYQIWLSTDGTPNNWTVVRYVFGNTFSATSDSFSTQANVRYVQYVLTSWNSDISSYGPAMTSLTFSYLGPGELRPARPRPYPNTRGAFSKFGDA